MTVIAAQRLRRLWRGAARYLVGWRGLLILVAAASSAGIVGLTVSSVSAALAAFGAVLIPLAVVGLLMANQESRTRSLVSSMRKNAGVSAGVPPISHRTESQEASALIPLEPKPGEQPLVAVVITVWNDSRFISAAIESVLSQSVQSFECIIVDDASTDDALEKVLQIVGHDARFKVLRHESNQGAAAARNTGLAAVQAPYVAFLDGDDFFYPGSLEERLSAMATCTDKPWIAGVYCQWVNVPESAAPGPAPTPAGKRRTVTWLNSLTDAPFTLTAPLMRVEVAKSVGGFPDFKTAEDTLFWNNVLREGYIFVPVHHVGVAYRMKRTSLFRRTAIEHANSIANALALNGRPSAELVRSGPYAFTEDAGAYLWDVTRVRRMVGALANAVEAGDDQGVAESAKVVDESLQAYHLWELPLEAVIRSQASRASRHVADPEFTIHRERVVDKVKRLLEARTAELIDDVRRGQAALVGHDDQVASSPTQPLEPPRRLTLSPELLSRPNSIVDGRVILMPSATYHIDETGPLSVELDRLGVECVVMVGDRRWPGVEWAQAAYRTPVVASVEAGPWLERAAGIVVMNDWGEEFREFVETANELGVPTFAKVEGVQDFEDDDVHWERKAYQRARWILAQGPNDVRALPMKDSIVVSSTRLERIWLDSPRGPVSPLVVVNLNFTYGVLDDARDMWMASVAEACEAASLPFVVSLHPAERDRWTGMYPVADVPIRHLLTKASVLVSRFSTVPFEAMARGVPFVYHNPHGEKVPTFREPAGAFDVTTSAQELVEALRGSQAWQVGYRDRCRTFFLNQVAVNRDAPASRRAAEAIATRLRRS